MNSYGKHHVDEADIKCVVDVLQGDFLTCGSSVDAFEDALKVQVGAKYAVACSNGTTALHLAMLALKIGAGDFVFVPAISFLASANAVRYVGADVIFVDVDPTTGLVSAEHLESAILSHQDKNLKAFINVHFAGQCENLEKIQRIAKKYGLLLIDDAAHSIGTVYQSSDGKRYPIGSNAFCDITTFSFHPVKTIAMGEGGAVTTNDELLSNQLRSYRSHCMIRDPFLWEDKGPIAPWYYEMHELGYNYRVSDINCALGLSQLKKLERFKRERERLLKNYDEAFKNSSFLTPLRKLKHSQTAWHLYVVLINFQKIGLDRIEFVKQLRAEQIGTQVHYIPIYRQPYYRKLYGGQELSGAQKYYEECLSLPLYVGLKKEEQEKIINVISRYE